MKRVRVWLFFFLLFSFTSAPFERSSLTTCSLSGTLAEIIRGVQPLPSYALMSAYYEPCSDD